MTGTQQNTSFEVEQMRDRMEAQVGRQRSQVERQAAFARAKIGKNAKMMDSDVIRAAKNLHDIIEQACATGRKEGGRLTKTAIVNEAGKRDGNGKSGALERFTRDPGDEDKDRGRLTREPAGYLKLAETAAKMAGLDPDEVVVALVQGTRLAEGLDSLPEDAEAEHLVLLSEAIRGEARRISEAVGLPWYFDIIEKQGLTPNGESWEADYEAPLWEWQTVPKVELVTEEMAVFGGDWWPKKADGSFGEKKRMAVWACRRIGLALAPFGPGREVRPYLVRRPVVVLTPIPKPRKAGVPLSLSDLTVVEAIVMGAPDLQGNIFSNRGTLHVAVEDAHEIWGICGVSDYPGDDHEFIEVSPASLAAVLDSGFPDALDVSGDALRLPKAGVTLSPPGTRAANLERDLRLGQHSDIDERPLMERLEERARNYVEGLRAWMYAQTAQIEEDLIRMSGGAK